MEQSLEKRFAASRDVVDDLLKIRPTVRGIRLGKKKTSRGKSKKGDAAGAELEQVESAIIEVRQERVILDSALAAI
jgi:hypothetical protein